MILRSYEEKDASEICKWVRDEDELYRWTAEVFDHFPVAGIELIDHYIPQIRTGRFMPFTAIDEEGHLLGHFTIKYPKDDDDTNVRFGYVIVNPVFRGHGIGKEMLRLGIEKAKELGAKRVELIVFANNEKAIRLYKSLGFKTYLRRDYEVPVGVWECLEMEYRVNCRRVDNDMNDFISALSSSGWQPICPEDKAVFDRFLRNDDIQTSEMSFTNLFVWRNHYGFRYRIVRDTLVVIAAAGEMPFALFPVPGTSEGDLKEAVDAVRATFEQNGLPPRICRVDKSALARLENIYPAFRAERDADNDDYVYLTEKLALLRGRRYDGKRNHIRRLMKQHTVEYVPVTVENLGVAAGVISGWYDEKGVSADDPERNATAQLLEHYEVLGCKGAILMADDEPCAVTFGEMLNTDTAVIHFEKAVRHISGAYPAINREFVAHEWEETMYINREQDLGIPGLRKSKQSYCPDHMIEKYTVYL